MNIVIFASDSKGVASVKNVVRQLSKTDHKYFFLYSEETQLQYPSVSLDNFTYDSNVAYDEWQSIWSDTLRITLPFTPDILLIQRDCWHPEQGIIDEFKTKWNSKVAMVEVNTHLVNNPETILEMHSRTKYPQNQIDLYFEQSEFTKRERGKSGFDITKSVVTGNPKFDDLMEGKTEHTFQKYKLDKQKTQILFYSIINVSRNEMFECLKSLVHNIDVSKYEILFKPYPGEPYNDKFAHQFFPFIFESVKVVYDDADIYSLSKICDIHIGAISSIMHFPLLLGKKIININNFCTYLDGASSIDKFLNESNIGIEDSAKFWMRVHNIPTYEKFIELLNPARVLTYKQDIDYFTKVIQECTISFDDKLECLHKDMPDTKELLNLFDSFNDFKASERIIKEMEKLYV